MTLYLPVGSALFVDTSTTSTPSWQKLTEHNRQPVGIDSNRIEKAQRTSNGTLRKIFIADKISLSTSWSALPSYSTMTVDAGWGAEDMRSFYNDKGKGTFKVKIAYNSSRSEEKLMAFNSFNMTMTKRNVKEKISDTPQAFWEISFSLDEV